MNDEMEHENKRLAGVIASVEAERDEARARLGAVAAALLLDGERWTYAGLAEVARRVVDDRDNARAEVERLRGQLAFVADTISPQTIFGEENRATWDAIEREHRTPAAAPTEAETEARP